MTLKQFCLAIPLLTSIFSFSLYSDENTLPEEMKKIMHQSKYNYGFWGLCVKDLKTGEILYDVNSQKLFSPASTTKIFSVSALLHAFGDDYRFKTPIFATGSLKDGQLQGDLILVAQGDLTMGGRQSETDKISYTKLDHINANEVPGVILTKEDPLNGLNNLAEQIFHYGIREINGDILIDDTLFETTEKRGMSLSPIMINENLIDFTINPTTVGKNADLVCRPEVPGHVIVNNIKTVDKNTPLSIEVLSDDSGTIVEIKGTIPMGQHDVIRTYSIENPKAFARAALIEAIKEKGIKINLPTIQPKKESLPQSYKNLKQVALWTSPPLSEYAKLILKVSHNLGANLIPLLLASREQKKTFEEGMQILGNFVIQDVKLSPNSFVLIDGAGGNENRFTPQAEVQLLEYLYKLPKSQFQSIFDALPILGVDGSLEDFAKDTAAKGKVRAKTGTGVAYNLATNRFFLITQALAGYIEGKNGHLLAYMLTINNGEMPVINDIFQIFEDVSQISSIIYENSRNQ